MECPPPQLSVPSSDFNVPIALRKGKRSCTDYPISHFISYDRLTLSFRQFALSLSSVSLPRSYEEAILISAWKQAMDEEIDTSYFSRNLGVDLCTQRCCCCGLSMGLYLEVSPRWLSGLLPKDILKHMA